MSNRPKRRRQSQMNQGPRILVPGPNGRMEEAPPAAAMQAPTVQDVANRLVMDIGGEGSADFVGSWGSIEKWIQDNPEEYAGLVPGQRRTLQRMQLVAGFQSEARGLEEEFRTGEGSGSIVVQHDGGEDPEPPSEEGDIKPQITD